MTHPLLVYDDRPACPCCLALAKAGKIRRETVMPLQPGALAPIGVETRGPVCCDCAGADTLARLPAGPVDFVARRICTGNDRQMSLRLPGVPYGLAGQGIIPISEGEDAVLVHHAWLNKVWPGWDEDDTNAI